MRRHHWKKYGIGAGAMLVLVVAIVLATGSGSAVAAQITNVFVTNDATHPVPVHEQGTASVNVTNTARVQTAIPAGAFSVIGRNDNGVMVISGPDPAGTSYAITSFTITNDEQSSVFAAELFAKYGSSDCTARFDNDSETVIGPRILIPPLTTVHLPFPQPFVFSAKAGANACLAAFAPASSTIHVAVVGYRF